jgi:two-component system nitrogen regulation response regulator GlnG
MAPGQSIDVPDLPTELRNAARDQAKDQAGDVAHRAASADWLAALAREVDRVLASAPGQVAEQLTQQFESTMIRRALVATGGRRIEAAQLLGLGRNTITRKIQELGLEDNPVKVSM